MKKTLGSILRRLRFLGELTAVLIVATLCGGCALALREDPPQAELIAEEKIQLRQPLSPAETIWPAEAWWRDYGDEQLNQLIGQALVSSPGLAVARRRVEVAAARADLSRAEGRPMIGGMADINRQHLSDAGFLGAFAKDIPPLGLTGPWYTSATLGLVGSQSLDIWGLNRSKVEAALGAENAQRAELAQAQLVLAAAITRIYYEFQTLSQVRQLQREALSLTEELVRGHRARHRQGLEPVTVAEVFEAQRAATAQELTRTEAEVNNLREALRALLGHDQLPPELKTAPWPKLDIQLPSTLGYELLARRADLQAARWTIQASLKGVDAAKAAFYPSFDLKVFFGLDSIHLNTLFNHGSRQLDMIAGMTLPIFDSGRLNANLAATRGESNLIIAEYNQAVVEAVREVAQAGWALTRLERETALQRERLRAMREAENSAQQRYKQGLTDKLNALAARLPVLAERARLATLRYQRLAAQVELNLALGGGFFSPTDPLSKTGGKNQPRALSKI